MTLTERLIELSPEQAWKLSRQNEAILVEFNKGHRTLYKFVA